MMHKILTLVLLTLNLILLAPQAMAGPYQFEGIEKADLIKIKSDLVRILESPISYEGADKIVRYLISIGSYQNVAAYHENGSVVVVGYALKRVGKVLIEGNDVMSNEELQQVISIGPDDKFERKRVVEIGNKLKDYYGNNGYFNTKIEVTFVPTVDNKLDITFKIRENDPCLIENIIIESANERLNRKLYDRVRGFKRDPFTETLIKEVDRRATEYLRKNSYLKSQLEQVKVEYNEQRTVARLYYQVSFPYNYELIIKDLESLNIYSLKSKIGISDLQGVSADPAAEIEQKAKRIYLENGYPHVKATATIDEKSNTFLKLIRLEIKEGPRVKIETLEVAGRISRPAQYYSNFIFKNSSELIQSGYYNKQDLDLGYENLITFLKNEGYLRAKIHSARVEYDKNLANAKIQMVMDEGPLTQIRKIRFKGAKNFSDLELSKVINLETNSPLRLRILEKSIDRLKEFYLSRGYLEMSIKNENENLISYNDKGTEAFISFEIYEGPKVIVNSIKIEGNSFTKEDVILNEADLVMGEVLTKEKIENATKRLNRLGLFSRVNIQTLERGSEIASRTVLISVSERRPGLFRSGIGITSEDNLTFRSFVGASYNNLWGTARGLSGRVELKSNITQSQELQSKVNVGYLEPFIFSTRTRGRVNLTYQLEEVDFEEVSGIANLRESNRIDLLLLRDLTENLKLTWTLWSKDAQRNFQSPDNSPKATEPFEGSSQDIVTIGPLFELDYRDSPFLPRSGSYTRWDSQYSSPNIGSSDTINFVRTELKFSHYKSLFNSGIIWANNLSGGFLKNFSEEILGGVPGSRSFFLHGQSKMRGYGGSSSREHIPNGDQFKDQAIVTGESTYYLFKTEFRFPFPLFDSLALAIFYDAGAVMFTDPDKQCVIQDENKLCLSDDPLRQSFGIGLHFNTPLGPIVLEAAQKLEPRYKERLVRYHFSIGSF